MQIGKWILAAALAVCAFGTTFTRGDVITYAAMGPDGSQTVNGKAVFTLSSNQLTIDLTNETTASNMNSTAELLTGLEFNLAGSLSLSNGSATGETVDVNSDLTLTTPSSMQNLDQGWGGGNLGGNPDEYAAAAGLNLGSGKSFNGTNLDGADYALIPAITAVANADGFTQHSPYTYGSVTLTFTVTGTGTLASDLSNVTFLFGTTPDATPAGTITTIVPEPTSLAGILLALSACVGARRLGRMKRSNA